MAQVSRLVEPQRTTQSGQPFAIFRSVERKNRSFFFIQYKGHKANGQETDVFMHTCFCQTKCKSMGKVQCHVSLRETY